MPLMEYLNDVDLTPAEIEIVSQAATAMITDEVMDALFRNEDRLAIELVKPEYVKTILTLRKAFSPRPQYMLIERIVTQWAKEAIPGIESLDFDLAWKDWDKNKTIENGVEGGDDAGEKEDKSSQKNI